MAIPTVPLENHNHVHDEKKGMFDLEYVRGRSQWVRPSVSSLINSRDSAAKLSALGFDPIETMVRKFDEIQSVIDQLMLSPKPSMVAISTMFAIQQKISNDLIKYGYAQVPVNTGNGEVPETTRIVLTDD
jgi:predicted glycosyltransferase